MKFVFRIGVVESFQNFQLFQPSLVPDDEKLNNDTTLDYPKYDIYES